MENKYFIVGKLLFVDYLFEIREKGLVGSESDWSNNWALKGKSLILII